MKSTGGREHDRIINLPFVGTTCTAILPWLNERNTLRKHFEINSLALLFNEPKFLS
jgi:hypothetical protein